jgi:hypothetical protein
MNRQPTLVLRVAVEAQELALSCASLCGTRRRRPRSCSAARTAPCFAGGATSQCTRPTNWQRHTSASCSPTSRWRYTPSGETQPPRAEGRQLGSSKSGRGPTHREQTVGAGARPAGGGDLGIAGSSGSVNTHPPPPLRVVAERGSTPPSPRTTVRSPRKPY